jgi:hypothetical protein
MFSDEAFCETEFFREKYELAVLLERFRQASAWGVDWHRKKAKFHRVSP